MRTAETRADAFSKPSREPSELLEREYKRSIPFFSDSIFPSKYCSVGFFSITAREIYLESLFRVRFAIFTP